MEVILGWLKVCWNELLEHFPKRYDRKYRSVLIRNGDSIRFYSFSLSETFRNKIPNALNSNSAGCFDIRKLGSVRIFDQPALADVKIVSRHLAGTNQRRSSSPFQQSRSLMLSLKTQPQRRRDV